MNVGNIIGVLMPTRALNLQVFSLSLCRTHLFALLSTFLNFSYLSYQQTLLNQQILCVDKYYYVEKTARI